MEESNCLKCSRVERLVDNLRNRRMGLDGSCFPKISYAFMLLESDKVRNLQDEGRVWDMIYDGIADLVENTMLAKPLKTLLPARWQYIKKRFHYFEEGKDQSLCWRVYSVNPYYSRSKGIGKTYVEGELDELCSLDKCRACEKKLKEWQKEEDI